MFIANPTIGRMPIKPSNPQLQSSPQSSRIWAKKSLQIEADIKDLRETGSTLNPTPKSKTGLKPTDFDFLKFLGNGKFGAVYLARHISTGFIFAMKVINKMQIRAESKEQTDKMINQLIRQIKIQMFLDHPNLIKLYSFFSDEYKIYLLMEIACDGQLYEYMSDGTTFSQESASYLTRQVLLGIDYMHERHVIHRDIKPQNIVLIHGIPKICDFGWSVYCPKDFRSTLCGTPLYLSPQILRGDCYNQKIDTWALGTLTYEMLTGENPFKITKKSQISKIVTESFMIEFGPPSTRDFLHCCLEKQPQKRMNSKQMLQHPFITKYSEIQTSDEICKKIQSKHNKVHKNK